MLRLVLIVLIVLVMLVLAAKLVRDVRKANVDWTGVATIIGFIVLAFYLRHVSGWGG